MHYESGAALPPTLDYFGCSKKVCLLCESFLQALARPLATRGRHPVNPAQPVNPVAGCDVEPKLSLEPYSI